MAAKIIAMNHEVITYTFNGKKRYIVEELHNAENKNYRLVMDAINQVDSRDWSKVYNYLDTVTLNSIDGGLERMIDRFTV